MHAIFFSSVDSHTYINVLPKASSNKSNFLGKKGKLNTTYNNNIFFFRSGGEMAEMNFCDQKSLSMPTLRMTSEAKV